MCVVWCGGSCCGSCCGCGWLWLAVAGCGWLWLAVGGAGVGGRACLWVLLWVVWGWVRQEVVGLAVERLTCCAPFACVLPPVFAVLLLLLLPVGVSGAAALGWHGYCSGNLLLGVFLVVTALLACVVTIPLVALETAGRK